MTPPLSPEERAEKITPCWQPQVEGCLCPMHALRPQIVDQIRQVVEEATVDMFENMKKSHEEGFSEAIEQFKKIIPSHPAFNMNATLTYLELDQYIRSLQELK